MKILLKPLTMEEITTLKDKNNYIEGIIKINLDEAIYNDFEGFLDLISDKLTGSKCLMEINYSVVGTEEGSILIKVSGDVSMILEDNEE